MPVYLLHGFRWPRPQIRIHIILQNLDDAAAEWLVAPPTTLALLKNFSQLYPESMAHLHHLRFIEQYDPGDTSPSAASQPFAYVADVVEEIRLGVDVDEVRGRGVGNDQWSAMMELRDKLASEEKVAWYVVVCGDEERWAPPTMSVLQGAGHNGTGSVRGSESDRGSTYTESRNASVQDDEPRGLKKLFGSARGIGKRKSRVSVKDLQQPDCSNAAISPQADQGGPSLPGTAVGGPLQSNGPVPAPAMNGSDHTSPTAGRSPPAINGHSTDGYRKPVQLPVRFSNSPTARSPDMTRAMSPEHRKIVSPQSNSPQSRGTAMSPTTVSPEASFDQARSLQLQAIAAGSAISPTSPVNRHDRDMSDQSIHPHELLANKMFESDTAFVAR